MASRPPIPPTGSRMASSWPHSKRDDRVLPGHPAEALCRVLSPGDDGSPRRPWPSAAQRPLALKSPMRRSGGGWPARTPRLRGGVKDQPQILAPSTAPPSRDAQHAAVLLTRSVQSHGPAPVTFTRPPVPEGSMVRREFLTGVAALGATVVLSGRASEAQMATARPHRIDVHHHHTPPPYLAALMARNVVGPIRDWT